MSNYVTLEEFKAVSQLQEFPIDDEAQRAIDAAEEALEKYCGRRFYQSGTAVARYYTARNSQFVIVDDLMDCDTVKTDDDGDGTAEQTWTVTTDFYLSPYNAEEDGEPWTRIERNPETGLYFPGYRRGVEVTGQWGWPVVPDAVAEATILQATRFLKRTKTSTFGVETVTVDGQPVRLRNKLDPDVEVMLTGFRRNVVRVR